MSHHSATCQSIARTSWTDSIISAAQVLLPWVLRGPPGSGKSAPPARAMDAKKIRRSNGMVWSFKMGQMVSFLIHIGDRLNLFATLLRASMEAGLAVTTDELVATTGYDRRWLMEWLRGMAAAKVLEYKEGDDNTERFHLSPEMGEVLVNESTSLTYAAGAFVGMADRELSEGIVNAFRTGVGMSYRARSLAGGEDGPLQTARLLGAWTRIALVPQIIARLGA